jgi:hypothetical protein
MQKPELDEHCQKIFAFLVMNDDGVRFNELHRTLNRANYKISRPTLVVHLNHLQEYKVVKREIEGKQSISYEVNWGELDYLKYHKNFRKAAEKIQKDKATFETFGLDEKIRYVSFILSLIEVTRLKNEIRSFLEPDRRFEATLTYLFVRSYLESFRMYLLQTCVKSKETAQEALIKVEELEHLLQNEVFDHKPESK